MIFLRLSKIEKFFICRRHKDFKKRDYHVNSHLEELNKISEWRESNKRTLNEAKTKFKLVGKKDEHSESFNWINAEVQAKTVVKNLGVLIDYQLDFREHVNFIENFISNQFPDKNRLVKIFKQYDQHRYQHAVLIYVTTTKLQRQQNFFLNSFSIKEIGRGSHDKKKSTQ